MTTQMVKMTMTMPALSCTLSNEGEVDIDVVKMVGERWPRRCVVGHGLLQLEAGQGVRHLRRREQAQDGQGPARARVSSSFTPASLRVRTSYQTRRSDEGFDASTGPRAVLRKRRGAQHE